MAGSMNILVLILLLLPLLFHTALADRPQLVLDALSNNKPIYYFGLGSNMSRTKLENRSPDGQKIKILKMQPAVVPNYRLAFSLRGFPPLEPGMGSLEHVDDNSHKPLMAYQQPECHGALVRLTPENYERVMKSEGINPKTIGRRQGYEEIVVEAYPYGILQRPVQAVALRAKHSSRLRQDACPSKRYMKILKEGARELGLKQSYQDFLAEHPVQELKPWQKKPALYNLVVVSILSFRLKLRFISRMQSRLLYFVYARPTDGQLQRNLRELLTLLILLPGSVLGFVLYHILLPMKMIPAGIQRFMTLLGEEHDD